MPSTAPRPDEPRPLNERERRALEGIGCGLAADSPRLGAELARGRSTTPSPCSPCW
ncbi:hypothetical protein SAMN05216207_10873 [Pseudonocardia ammonioxydans]|uniref:Uncharacterized protein n=1 Tax=Pseudonocardia ammonioxydans TaxID=260086 RepID=A0A1I5I4S6_PSUAM|nr:hypothetical protein [Pseudonocardia ammonioxydans]SFO55537.1 hypothetical protein SAMN05216207_10873 [Pseudonocardia ammonioxydans]